VASVMLNTRNAAVHQWNDG